MNNNTSYRRITALHAPDTAQLVKAYIEQLYVGTEQGSLYVYTPFDRSLKRYSKMNCKLLFPLTGKLPEQNMIVSIKAHKNKPHKLLIGFRNLGAIIWNMKKNTYARRITAAKGAVVMDVQWAYECDCILLALQSGSVAFCSIKGKTKGAGVVTLKICPEPIMRIFWIKHPDANPIMISFTLSGSILSIPSAYSQNIRRLYEHR